MVDAGGSSIAADGRADKLSVQALLARVYMTLKGFPFNDASAKANAQGYLTKVLQNGSSYFAPTIEEWKKQWMTDNAISNKYQIFAIQHRLGTGLQITFTSGTMIKNLTYVTDGYHSGSEMNPVYPEATLRYEYVSNDDPRGLGWSFIDGYDEYDVVVSEFIKQYYSQLADPPKEILVPRPLREEKLIGEMIGARIHTPERGDKYQLLKLAQRDVIEIARSLDTKVETQKEREDELRSMLSRVLGYDKQAYRVESYDISNTNGVDTVGAMVVFRNLKPVRKDYRRFRIRTVEGPDAHGSLREMLTRRF